jgi:hypothetical protein
VGVEDDCVNAEVGAAASVPDYITHYHLRDRPPFLNLSDLDELRLRQVLAALNTIGRDGASERRFGSRYMQLRRATEVVLRDRFVARGGRPERSSPHYFVLGDSEWFAGLYTDAGVVHLPLAEMPSELVSFTYPDSMTSMGLSQDFGIPVAPRPYHGTVYRIEELADVVALHGYPRPPRPNSYDRHQFEEFEHYIEVQVWSDDPVRRYLV